MSLDAKVSSERKCEIAGVLILGLTLAIALALLTDGFQDSGESARVLGGATGNLFGFPGAWFASVLAILVGDASHVLYSLTLIWGLMLLVWHRPVDRLLTRFVGTAILTGAVAGMLQVNFTQGLSNAAPGGFYGAFVADMLLQPYFGSVGGNIIGATLAVIGLLLATDFLFVHLAMVANALLIHTLRGSLGIFSGALIVYRALLRQFSEVRETLQSYQETRRANAEAYAVEAEYEEEVAADVEDAAEESGETPLPKAATRPNLRRKPVEDKEAPMPAPPELEAEPEPDSLDRINVVTRADDDESPFDAVPEVGDSAADYVDAPRAVALDLEAAEAQEAQRSQEDSLEEETLDLDETEEEAPEEEPAQMDLIDEAPPAPKKAPRKPRFTRVVPQDDVMEELPADYQYPKRYSKPPFDIFDRTEARIITNLDEQLRATGVLLEDTLQTFGIDARVTDVTRGPTITRFEVEPAPGIKVSRFLALSDDIALALKAHRVRVEAPIPGKSRVGIEVPNYERDQVLIRELLERRSFSHGKGKLNLAMGKDISGEVVITDLATMPHLLVAGATGAGKTVCIKALMASLLCAHVPDELQLMLIDPKMVELSIFNDIPHLITPVVTDPKKASTALTWLINEMEERYRLFADLRVRNIEVYNHSVENGEIEVEGAEEGDEHHSMCVVRKLPYIVCIIDELADLMMLARAEVEDSIARLAQLARAVGIHLIIATQRPSVDVLTGVIKANFPARVSFQVSSRVDSRCILDEIGAERLIGMGDMLYLPAGQSKPTRIQGAFVSDREMNSLIAHLKRQAPPQYRDEIENYGRSKDNIDSVLEEGDPLLDEAIQVVHDTGQASISMVQRRLRVGYTRAARLIDMMEMKGIIGPHTGSKAREILVSASQKDEVA